MGLPMILAVRLLPANTSVAVTCLTWNNRTENISLLFVCERTASPVDWCVSEGVLENLCNLYNSRSQRISKLHLDVCDA